MTGSLLLRGMLTGLIAGVIAFAFAFWYGEPQVDLAIAFEEQMAAADPAADTMAEEEAPIVSRATQATTGLATALLVYGTAVGGIFALVFAFAYGRLGALGARATSGLLAAATFVSVVLVPQMKYPANPPAVGYDDTIAARTTLFFVMLVLSIAVMVGAIVLARQLWAAHGGWRAATIALAAWLVAVAVIFAALPPITEMPEGFSPLVIWDFRVSSIGIHLILWAVIGLGFGALAERLLEPRRPAAWA